MGRTHVADYARPYLYVLQPYIALQQEHWPREAMDICICTGTMPQVISMEEFALGSQKVLRLSSTMQDVQLLGELFYRRPSISRTIMCALDGLDLSLCVLDRRLFTRASRDDFAFSMDASCFALLIGGLCLTLCIGGLCLRSEQADLLVCALQGRLCILNRRFLPCALSIGDFGLRSKRATLVAFTS